MVSLAGTTLPDLIQCQFFSGLGQVNVEINSRKYQIACDDGQEAHLSRLGSYVDNRIGELVAAVGQIGDARLLVMASLCVLV